MTRRSIAAPAVITLTLLGGFFAGRAWAYQTQVQMAVQSLQSAQMHLKAAGTDKDGHNEKALLLVNQALAEIKPGPKFVKIH